MGGKPGTAPMEKPLHQSGFGGWVDERIKILREAAPLRYAPLRHTRHFSSVIVKVSDQVLAISD
jgi:hypothetical protein